MAARRWVMVEELCNKPEGRGFENLWGEIYFSNLPNSSILTRPWVLLSP
jgi:hypothetical protein